MLKLNDTADYFNYGSLYIKETEKLLYSFGIEVKNKNEYRGFWDVIEQIAMYWDYYTPIQQLAIAKAIAGDDRGSFIIAMSYGRK